MTPAQALHFILTVPAIALPCQDPISGYPTSIPFMLADANVMRHIGRIAELVSKAGAVKQNLAMDSVPTS